MLAGFRATVEISRMISLGQEGCKQGSTIVARYDADWIASMLDPARRGSPPAEETIARLGVRPGQVVADVGCGPGFFTLPLARRVWPGGRVYAIDIEPRMLDIIRARAADEGLNGIETRCAAEEGIPLDSGMVDLALCGLVLHDLADRASMGAELARVVRPGGRVAVIEWMPASGEERPNRLSPEETARLLAAAGLCVEGSEPVGTRQYLVVATRGVRALRP